MGSHSGNITPGGLVETIQIHLRGAVVGLHPRHLLLDLLTLLVGKEQVFRQLHTTHPATTGPAAVDDGIPRRTIHDGPVVAASSGAGAPTYITGRRPPSSQTPSAREIQARSGSWGPSCSRLLEGGRPGPEQRTAAARWRVASSSTQD